MGVAGCFSDPQMLDDTEQTDESTQNGPSDPGDTGTEDDGSSDDAVENLGPFTANPLHTSIPTEVVFTASVDGEVSAYDWRVDGEDEVKSGRQVYYDLPSGGIYTVTLSVTREGTTEEHTREIEIEYPPENSPPVVGDPVPALVDYEQLVLDTRELFESPGAVFAVAYDGKPILTRGYGWRDLDYTEPMTLNSLFRIASLSKRVTRAGTYQFLQETEFTAETKPFEVLDLEPLGGELADERVYAITIQQCIDHELGWDRDETMDPVFSPREIALELDLDRPPTTEEIVSHWLTEPLQFEPGTEEAYSNIGYSILELLIEQERDMDFMAFLRDRVLEPAGIERMYAGRTFPEDRHKMEVEYYDERMDPKVDVFDEAVMVPTSDGGELYLESALAPAGLIATAPAYLKFMTTYNIETGAPREGNTPASTHQSGLIDNGTAALALQRKSGIDVVAMFNSAASGIDEQQQVDIAVAAINDVDVDAVAEQVLSDD
jgi:CubicO group peptidase (beta-lactamase class C family)